MNPIMCSPGSDSDTSHLLYRGRGDGRVGESDDDSLLRSHDDSDIITNNPSDLSNVTIEDQNNIPDSDFDDFDSNEEEEEAAGETHGSQDNEIHEIYYVQESKQTRILGRCFAANFLFIKMSVLCKPNHNREDTG